VTLEDNMKSLLAVRVLDKMGAELIAQIFGNAGEGRFRLVDMGIRKNPRGLNPCRASSFTNPIEHPH
jgi:hypothetical protein